MIPVSQPYLPCIKKYKKYIDSIYASKVITNRGQYLVELEDRLKEFFNVKHVICTSNGSLALQLIFKSLELSGSVITTPFSFAATSSTLLWEGLKPVYSDIDSRTLNISPSNIESNLSSSVSAILATHVYGNPCDLKMLSAAAKKHKLQLIYDAAHAFGVKKDGISILSEGHASALSFHGTKLFHTIEGGAVVTNDDKTAKKIRALMNFGLSNKIVTGLPGTNAKMNEFEAAMGLCVLDDIDIIFEKRKEIWTKYVSSLGDYISLQQWEEDSSNNYSYAPIIFKNETELLKVLEKLSERGIQARRYFYPSLDSVYSSSEALECNVSQDISRRILCLPLYPALTASQQTVIIKIILESLMS